MLLFLGLHAYFEEYEGIFSSFVQGLYTEPCTKDWNVDVHFLLFAWYAELNRLVPEWQVYGLVMLFYNWIALTLLGLALYRLLQINLRRVPLVLWLSLYVVLAADNIVNLSTNRIAFALMAAVIGLAESFRLEGKPVSPQRYALLFAGVLFAALLRSEIVILTTLVCLLLYFLRRRAGYPLLYAAFAAGMLVFVIYNYVIIGHMSEARQIYYFKELDFIMRNNYDYAHLAAPLRFEIDAFYHYIMDREHMTWDFYNAISIRGKETGVLAHFYGLHIDPFLNTLQKAAIEYRRAWYFIAFQVLLATGLLVRDRERRTFWTLHLTLTTLFPVLICFYVVTPLRFLVPYYSAAGIYYFLRYRYAYGPVLRMNVLLGVMVLLVLGYAYSTKQRCAWAAEQTDRSLERIGQLEKKYPGSLPVVINNFNAEKFFPSDPCRVSRHQPVLFQNLYFFMAYDCFLDKWKAACACDPLSLKAKIDYTVEHGNLFVVEPEKLGYLQDYLADKYHVRLKAELLEPFDSELNIYRLTYTATAAP